MTGHVKTLQSKIAFQSRAFHVESATYQLPNGAAIERDTVRHPGAAAVLPFLDSETVLMVRQYRPAAGDWLLEVPAGTLTHLDEKPIEAAIREMEEETGYVPKRIEPLISFFPTPGFVSEKLHLFVAWNLEAGTANPDDDEHVVCLKMPWAEVKAQVANGQIRDGKTVALVTYLLAFPSAMLNEIAGR